LIFHQKAHGNGQEKHEKFANIFFPIFGSVVGMMYFHWVDSVSKVIHGLGLNKSKPMIIYLEDKSG
jgi:hypothetical protein